MRSLFRAGGGGGVSAQNFSAPLRKPKAPQCPPTEKILATPTEMKERVTRAEGGGGGAEEEEKIEKCPQYSIQSIWSPHFQLKSLA